MTNGLVRAAVRAFLGTGWLVKAAGRGRSSGPDKDLDRQIAAILGLQRSSGSQSVWSMDPVRARQFESSVMVPFQVDTEPMAHIGSITVEGEAGQIPVRVYAPEGAGPDWMVYFHGGGGVIGSVASFEPTARYLAARTRCTVASVEYRLAPEHKHPAAIEDACAAWRVLSDRVPPSGRVAVAGESFGGFLAAHVERNARVTGGRRPDLQVLVYPLLDLTASSASVARFSDGYVLTAEAMRWFFGHYLNPGDDPRSGSPWHWDDLSGSAPAIVVTAGFDPLVDEGDGWAERLGRAGTTVRHLREPSLVHGFVCFAGAVREARRATDRLCSEIVDLLCG